MLLRLSSVQCQQTSSVMTTVIFPPDNFSVRDTSDAYLHGSMFCVFSKKGFARHIDKHEGYNLLIFYAKS